MREVVLVLGRTYDIQIITLSAKGSPGPAGVGGVLRDHMGKILCFFSSFVGCQDAITAEIYAIVKACQIIGSKSELINRSIVVASDSRIAVGWISGQFKGYNNHEKVSEEIREWLVSFGQAAVEFCPRSSNSYADILARKGEEYGVDEVCWSDF